MDFELLNEGGAAGHMNHLYDNGELTFAKIKEIFTAAANGQLIGTEKTDGQNLMISFSVHDGRAKGVRNKGEIKAGGLNPEELAMKFADRANPALKETFADALRIFEKAVQGLDFETQTRIFGPDTNIYYNAEVMDPRTPNVINYDTKTLVIHRAGHAEFDRATGDRKDIDVSEQAKELEDIIIKAQDHLKNEEYGIQMNAVKRLQGLSDKKALEEAINDINKMISAANSIGTGNLLSDDSSINDFMLVRINSIINHILEKEKTNIGEVNALARMSIAKRVLGISGYSVKNVYKHLTPEQKPVIKEKILNDQSIKNILKTAILPLENTVSDFATEMLRDLRSAFILDNSKEISRLRAEVQQAINAIKNSGNAEAIQILKLQLQKLKSADRVSATAEGFVFDYDGVTYKFTGNFAPVNQLLGLFKYGRGKVPPIKKELNEQTEIEDYPEDQIEPEQNKKVTGQENPQINFIPNDSNEESENKNFKCIYPGRFQPMGRHHLETFKKLQQEFGAADVFIATSNVVDLPLSPLDFNEKKEVMLKHGIPSTQIFMVKNPYSPVEITSKFDPEDTVVVFAVGEKDMKENPRFRITDKSYFQRYSKDPIKKSTMNTYKENGYLMIAPHVELDIDAIDDKGIRHELNIDSGTQIRSILSSGDKNLFTAIMGEKFGGEDRIFNLLYTKFKNAAQVGNVEKSLEKTKKKSKKNTPASVIPTRKKIVKENMVDVIINEIINEHIVNRGDKYCLISKKSRKNLGCYDSKSGAEERERQVQYFKHLKEMSAMSAGAITVSANAKRKEEPK